MALPRRLAHLLSWRRWSLHRRIVVGVVALVAVVLAVTGVASLVLLRASLVRQVDEQLTTAAPPFFGGFAQRDPYGPARQGPDLPSTFVVTVLTAGGTVVSQEGGSLLSGVPGPDVSGMTAARVDELDGAVVTLPGTDGGPSYRARAQLNKDGRVVVLAVSMGNADSTLRTLAGAFLALAAAVLALAAGLAALVVHLGLRPLDDVEATAQAFAAGDLSQRVPDAPPTTEVGRLTASLNGMLGQIERAFASREASEDRLRRFVGDAGHELRTPLTSIRGYSELLRVGAVPPEERAEVLRRIEAEAARMGGLVDELLLLARLDQQRPLERVPVDLRRVVDDAVAAARARQPERPLSWEPPGEEPVKVVGDPQRLRQVLDNLLGNALTHTPPGSPVRVELAAPATVTVSDAGPGMTAEQARHAFDRFYRADPARSRGGSGLGLAIVQAVVVASGGTVGLTSTVGDGTTVRVDLPAAGAGAGAGGAAPVRSRAAGAAAGEMTRAG